MIKRAATFKLKTGTDPESFWQYYTTEVSNELIKKAGSKLKKFAVGHVTAPVSGDPSFWGLEETWWDNEKEAYEACDRGATTGLLEYSARDKTVTDNFWEKVTDGCTAYMEEFTAKDITDQFPRMNLTKRVAFYTLRAGTDPEAFWKYHITTHAEDGMKWGGDRLKKYVISHVVRPVSGVPQFWGMVETWWGSEREGRQAFDAEGQELFAATGKTIMDDFWDRVTGGFICFVTETSLNVK